MSLLFGSELDFASGEDQFLPGLVRRLEHVHIQVSWRAIQVTPNKGFKTSHEVLDANSLVIGFGFGFVHRLENNLCLMGLNT